MKTKIGKQPRNLGLGDLACFILGLGLALILRDGGWPRMKILELYALPFALIFFIWILVFYIAGLYDIRSILFRGKLLTLLVTTQLINSGVVILFFYTFPTFLIAPKTVLILDLVITLILLFVWRSSYLSLALSGNRERTLVVGESALAENMKGIIASTPRLGFDLVDNLPADIIIFNLHEKSDEAKLTELYPRLFEGTHFIDLEKMYEELTARVPLSVLSPAWVLENISLSPKLVYTTLKRAMDIIISLPLALVSFIFYPFIFAAIKLETKGPAFISQVRIGRAGQLINLKKFRSMTASEEAPMNKTENKVTRVGKFLRKSRIDELPQLISVIKGDLSLVGPRPEFPAYVELYKKEIPFYDVRHVITPGLSGHAQIYHDAHPHHGAAVEQTRDKLSYDLYYIKNRSFLLDLKIALKTIKTLISRVGA